LNQLLALPSYILPMSATIYIQLFCFHALLLTQTEEKDRIGLGTRLGNQYLINSDSTVNTAHEKPISHKEKPCCLDWDL